MTRGRDANVLHVAADTLDDARAQFVEALQRDRADRGLEAATSGAHVAVTGLVAQGPVKVVNDERSRLVEAIAKADREAARWEHAAGLLVTQAEAHAHEEASARDALVTAEAHSASILDRASRPLLAQATVDGQAYLDAEIQRVATSQAHRSAGRLGRRAAVRRLDTAREEVSDTQETALTRWGSVPATGRWAAATRDGLEAWAARVTHQRAQDDPVVSRARQDVARADETLKQTWRRHRSDSRKSHPPDLRSTRRGLLPIRQRYSQRPSSCPTLARIRRRGARPPHPHRIPPDRTSRRTSSSRAGLEPSRSRPSEQRPSTEPGSTRQRNGG